MQSEISAPVKTMVKLNGYGFRQQYTLFEKNSLEGTTSFSWSSNLCTVHILYSNLEALN